MIGVAERRVFFRGVVQIFDVAGDQLGIDRLLVGRFARENLLGQSEELRGLVEFLGRLAMFLRQPVDQALGCDHVRLGLVEVEFPELLGAGVAVNLAAQLERQLKSELGVLQLGR